MAGRQEEKREKKTKVRFDDSEKMCNGNIIFSFVSPHRNLFDKNFYCHDYARSKCTANWKLLVSARVQEQEVEIDQ